MTDSDCVTVVSRFLLYRASGVNVRFEDILNHVTNYFLTCFTLKLNQYMIASVSSQLQNCECT